MKAVSVALLLSLSLAGAAAEVRPGDTLNDVRATLGAPKGQVQVGGRHLLYYDRGEIELQAGAVTRVALRSVEEQAALDAQRAAEAGRFQEEQEIHRARLSVEGEELKARKLADPFFRTAPVGYQVAFWENFSRHYPGVPSDEQLTIARLRLAEQLEQRRIQTEQAERLAELEARVSDAEARAEEAESSTLRFRNYSYYYGRSFGRRSLTLWPVQYPASVTGQPYLTPPVMPSAQGVGRHSRWSENRPDFNRRDNHGRDHDFDGGRHSFGGRNRL